MSSRDDLKQVKDSETRILLLYATKAEGANIMRWAKEEGLTSKSYIWVATQSVIGASDRSGERRASSDLPAGMLGTLDIFLLIEINPYPSIFTIDLFIEA